MDTYHEDCYVIGARLIRHGKRRFDDGMILEILLREVPEPMRGSKHRLKYSLFYGNDEGRLVGYDNQAANGDHRHYGPHQQGYCVTAPARLLEDFRADVGAIRRRN